MIEDGYRYLASDPYDTSVAVKIDYNILSIAALTLALILGVEVVRHRLDDAAKERPFFRSVLEGLYRELTTLGIVEFCLFIMAEYYPDYDKGRKGAFGDVHFCLFETALWNTLSTCVTATIAFAVSKRIWVQTERLDVTHYVELRRAFDAASIDDPRYANLLVQIRFHELRVQFLQAYRLPMQLQISDYLLRSEKAVLIKLVHISSTSWLLLTGAVCLLYYGIGMVYYHFPNQQLAGTILTAVFFGSVALFVVVSYAVSFKMRSIFRTIMHTAWDEPDEAEKERLRQAQLALFWGHRPENVIHLIQFMQFGYAVAISTLILFWKEIEEGPVPSSAFLVAVVVCWAIFVTVTGHAIPQYTLCTSLGQLVDERRLRETVAVFRLEEAKQLELERSMDVTTCTAAAHSLTLKRHHPPVHRVDTGVGELVSLDTDSIQTRVQRQNRNRRKTQSAGVAIMAGGGVGGLAAPSVDSTDSSSIVSKLSSDTASTSQHSRSRRPRGNRKKSLSDGVSAMFKMGLGVDIATKRNPMIDTIEDEDEFENLSEGYLSDDDDIPATAKAAPPVERLSPREKMRSYFLSDRYMFVSNVFGTIVALILVGERVEGFIQGLDLIAKDFVTLALPRSLSFWFLAAWLIFCLMLSWVIIYLLGTSKKPLALQHKVALVAAVLDCLVFSLCIVIFFVAEALRCCAGSEEEECSCLRFGSRLGNGLGNVEPFTVLVCLRVFRHWGAEHLVRIREVGENLERKKGKKHHSHEKQVGHGVVEAWEQAVRENPELVAKYGEFSGPLLRVMLGAGFEDEADGNLSNRNKAPFLVQGQEVVLIQESKRSFAEGNQSTSSRPLATTKAPSARKLFRRHSSVFEDLPPAQESMSIAGYDHMFDHPGARIVRTMRRCDRMFLPLLDFWVPVDVVLTRFEMVYFDAARSDGDVSEDQAESSRNAVIATKGGKGLRLGQVAVGRRVVGRMLLKDIVAIHVERKRLNVDESEAEAATTEFWKQEINNRVIIRAATSQSGNLPLQDRLRIDTVDGQTLYLRYYSDVEDAKYHPEHQADQDDGALFKNNAFQWAQTLARFCGKDQLKQPLPHYGQDNNDELRDFLVVADASVVSKKHRRGFDLRRRHLSPQRRRNSGSRNLLRLASTGARERTLGSITLGPDQDNDETEVASLPKSRAKDDLEIGLSTSY